MNIILTSFYTNINCWKVNRYHIFCWFIKINGKCKRITIIKITIEFNIVLDFDEEGKLVGIDIDNASLTVDITRLEAQSLPIQAVNWIWV